MSYCELLKPVVWKCRRNLGIVALSAIQLPINKSNLPAVIDAIDNATPGSFQVVECGVFSRKKPVFE